MLKKDNPIFKTYTTGQAAKATGVQYDQLNYMAKTGFLVPSVKKARGSTTCRVYDFRDLVALRIVRQLREAGIALQSLRKVAKYLQHSDYERPFADAYLVVTAAGDVAEKRGETLISTLHQPGQMYFVLALEETVDALRAAALKLKPPSRGKACAVA